MAKSVIGEPKRLDDDRDPWTKQTWESWKAWEAFELYRDGGPTRSIRAVAERLSKSEGMIGTWSTRNLWQERVEAYVIDQSSKNLATIEDERERIIRDEIRMGDSMMRLATTTTDLMEEMGAGVPLEMVPQFVATASKLRRLSAGLSTENQRGVLQITTADFERVINKLVNGTADLFVEPSRREDYLRWVQENLA